MDVIAEDISGEEGSDLDSEVWTPTGGDDGEGEDFCAVGGEDDSEDVEEDKNLEVEQTALEELRKAYADRCQGAGGEESDTESCSSAFSDSDSESQPEKENGSHRDFNQEERAPAPPNDLETRQALLEPLEKYRLFQNCDQSFLQSLLNSAERQCLAPQESLVLKDGGPLFIVETGALRLQVGSGSQDQVSVLGRGGILNGAGFLRLYTESQAFRPRRISFKNTVQPKSTRANGYDVQGYNGRAPSIYTDFRKFPRTPEDYQGPSSTKLNFFNACPYACQKNTFSRGTWLSFSARGGEPGEQPAQANTSSLPGGGATVLALPPFQKILEMLGKTNDYSFQQKVPFKQNCEVVQHLWYDLMSKLTPIVFPGAPVEAVYELATCAQSISVPVDGNVVTEGAADDDIVLITDGVAMVLKKVLVVDKQDQMETIGRLRAGSIIGDICLLRADMLRPATVRAKTDVETIRLDSKKLLDVLTRFPGMLESCRERLQDAAECIKERLLTRTEVASSLNLFSGCDLGFINDIANSGERRLLFAGDPVVQQGSQEGTAFVLEHGRCSVEVAHVGKVAELGTGTCFGERTLLGIASEANATVRVLTPFALALAILKSVLHDALQKHPHEQDHFERLKTSPQAGRIAGTKVRHIELFRSCGAGFLKVLNDSVLTSMYLYGQTVTVEGEVELDPKMFVLTGGIVVAEQDNRPLARMSPGATFGELAMRGQSKGRQVTIRAVTLSFVTSIRMTVFQQALDAFPEEKESFSSQGKETDKGVGRVVWPCLRGESSRLLYLLDLYAEKASCPVGDKSLGLPPLNEAAILVLNGEVSVLDEEGREVAVLTRGGCFNERILVGSRAKQTERLVPVTQCEVRVLTRETWSKVMAEFPNELGRVRETILRYMGGQAELRVGYEPGSPGLLRANTAFFASVSRSFAKVARETAQTRIFEPGMDIVVGDASSEEAGEQVQEHSQGENPAEGPVLDELVILLQGTAISKNFYNGAQRVLKPGAVIGEGVFVGASRAYPNTVTAQTTCVVQVFRRDVIFKAMQAHSSEDAALLKKLTDELEVVTAYTNRSRLLHSDAFKDSDPRFIRELARCNDIVLLRPGEVVIPQGEPCTLGKSSFFMVLAGAVSVEGAVGTIFGTVQAGGIFGEVGGFGLSPYRSATARAREGGLVCCLRFDGDVITSALESFPHAREKLGEAWHKLEARNAQTENERRQWIKDCAVPALGSAPLLVGCPEHFLHSLAVLLKEHTFQAGATIVKMGQKVQWMIMIVQGTVRMEARKGECIGLLKEGSVFGEVNALGLFPSCMATLRAASSCRVLILPHSAMTQVMQSNYAKEERIADAFHCLVDSRREQVKQGVPICGLGIDAPLDDVRVRTIALLSEKIELQPGEVWTPFADSNPNGPYIGMVHTGRAMIEIGAERHIVMQLTPGSIFPEGLAAAFGAFARAESFCEVYRVRQSDFQMVVDSVETPTSDWLWRFRLQKKMVVQKLTRRLLSVQGLLDLATKHPKDDEIHAWKDKRQSSLTRAKQMKDAKTASTRSAPHLPALPEGSEQSFSTRHGSWDELVQQKPGLASYTVFQLPRLTSRASSLTHSRSESKLTDMSSRQNSKSECES